MSCSHKHLRYSSEQDQHHTVDLQLRLRDEQTVLTYRYSQPHCRLSPCQSAISHGIGLPTVIYGLTEAETEIETRLRTFNDDLNNSRAQSSHLTAAQIPRIAMNTVVVA